MEENGISNAPGSELRPHSGNGAAGYRRFWLWRVLRRMRSGVFRLEGRLGIQRYRITAEGAALMCFIFLVGGAAWHSGTNLLYLIFAVLIAVFCSHGFMVWVALRRISVDRVVPRHVFTGKPAVIGVTLHNRRRFLPGYAFRVID